MQSTAGPSHPPRTRAPLVFARVRSRSTASHPSIVLVCIRSALQQVTCSDALPRERGPGGTTENSPAIHRWESRALIPPSPVGTTELQALRLPHPPAGTLSTGRLPLSQLWGNRSPLRKDPPMSSVTRHSAATITDEGSVHRLASMILHRLLGSSPEAVHHPEPPPASPPPNSPGLTSAPGLRDSRLLHKALWAIRNIVMCRVPLPSPRPSNV